MGRVKQHPRRNPDGTISNVREHFRNNEKHGLGRIELESIESEILDDLAGFKQRRKALKRELRAGQEELSAVRREKFKTE